MNTPEILLNRLTGNLLKLRAAVSSERDKSTFDKSINDAIRKIYLAQVLHQKSVTAIAGRQGAGKTTFLKNLYNLDEKWLGPNPGRGEQVPLLVLEKEGLTQPYAEVQELIKRECSGVTTCNLESRLIEPDEFNRLIKGWVDGQMLTTLYVPKKYFDNDNTGFLLLPGYEKINQDNEYWQDLMRHALLSSASSILVTDEQGMAANAEDLKKDIFNQSVSGSKPVIVISWSEGRSEDWIASSKDTTKKLYAIPENELDRVVFAGVSKDQEFMSGWKKSALDARSKYAGITSDFRFGQFAHMQKTLDDLNTTLYQIKDSVNDDTNESDDINHYRDLLKRFDSSVLELKRSYRKEVTELFTTKMKKTKQLAKDDYESKESGFVNKVKNMGDIVKSDYENEKRFISRINNAWNDADKDIDFANEYQNSTFKITSKNLRLTENLLPSSTAGLLGYSLKNVSGVGVVDGEIVNCLSSIFLEQKDLSFNEKNKLADAIKLVPVLAMEYLRIGSFLNGSARAQDVPAPSSPLELNKEIQEATGTFQGLKSTVFSAISTIFGLEAVDGKIDDLFPPVIGDTTTIPFSPVIQLYGFISLGVAAYSVLQQVKRYDAKQQGFIDSSIDYLYQASITTYMEQFDDYMYELRAYFESKISQRYGIESKVGSKDAILYSVKNVDLVRKEMMEMLNAGPILA